MLLKNLHIVAVQPEPIAIVSPDGGISSLSEKTCQNSEQKSWQTANGDMASPYVSI